MKKACDEPVPHTHATRKVRGALSRRAVDVLRAFYAEDLRVLRWLCASEWVDEGYCAAVELSLIHI